CMAGMLGRLFREFAVTISVAILVSGFVSLTLTPMMCSRFLKQHKRDTAHRSGGLLNWFERLYDRSLAFYERTLAWVMVRRRGTMVFSLAIFAATIVLFVVIPKGFIPTEDIGQINGSIEQVEGASYEEV